jgi:hypothetical protein
MALQVTTVGDNPFVPGSLGFLYKSDQLIAGDLKLVTAGLATITGGLLLPRGTVLGQVTIGAVTSAAKAGGNTGNGTNTVLSAGTRTVSGVYQIRFLTATTYTVTDPNGEALPNGANGAYANPNLNFTITAGGTPFIAGDGFDVTVAAGSNLWRKAVKTAVDGSQTATAILVDDADATGGDVNSGVYLTGEFNENRIAYDGTFTLVEIQRALRLRSIYLKSAVIADPPT